MILNNYWKAMTIFSYIQGGGYSSDTVDIGLVGIDGQSVPVPYRFYDQVPFKNAINLRDSYISAVVGKGTGDISANDYSLFDDCTADFANYSTTYSISPVDDGFSQRVTITGRNNTDSEITITEAGIIKSYGNDTSYDTWKPVMFAKVLLDNPITVQPNSSFVLTLEWKEA